MTKIGYFNTGFIFLRCKIPPDINQNDIKTTRKKYKNVETNNNFFFFIIIIFFCNGLGCRPSPGPCCNLQQNVKYSRSACNKKQKAGRRAVGRRQLPDVAELPNWSGGRRCCWGTEGGRGGVFFFFLLPCFFLSSAFSLLSPFLSSSLSFSRLVSPSLSVSPLSRLSFSLLPLPRFYRQKQGGPTWWGGHCWLPLHYPLIHGKRGKWVSLFGVFLKGGGVLLKANVAVNRR